MAKPISAKIAVISSMTWLIGWMRPRDGRPGANGKGHVDPLGLKPRGDRNVGQFLAAGSDGRLHAVAQAVQPRPGLAPLVRAHLAEPLQELGNAALLAEFGDADLFQRRLVGRGRDRLDHRLFQRLGGFGHAIAPSIRFLLPRRVA